MKREIYHVVKDQEGWKAEKEGNQRAIFKGPVKREVVNQIIDRAKNEVSQVKIHKADGTISEERTFPKSSDPRKYKG